MLNNKYLAIVLVIAAIVIVAYQIFFKKEEKTVLMQANLPATAPVVHSAALDDPETDAAKNREKELVIDFHSPLLLKKVYENPIERCLKRELSPEFGTSIFSIHEEYDALREDESKFEKEIQFRLNFIIIDNDKDRRIALINDTILNTGDFISGAKVINIQKSRVILKFKEKNIVLSTDSRIKTIKLIGGKSDR